MLVPYYNRKPEQTQSALCQIRDEHVTHDKLSYLHMIAQVSLLASRENFYNVIEMILSA